MLENKSVPEIEPELTIESGTFQFSISSLLKLTFISSLVLISVVNWGFGSLLIIFPLGLSAFLVLKKQYDDAVSVFILFVLAGCLIPNATTSRTPARRSICSNNLRQLVVATLNYESAHGSFPPAFTTDSAGNKLHSWRVLILPYLEHQNLYDAIDLSKPWDDPVNIKFASEMPDVFHCPSNKKSAPGKTSYVAVVGAATMWKPDGKPVIYSDITDGISNTILVIETNQVSVNWMEPADIDFNKIVKNKKGSTDVLQSPHPGGTQSVFADGSSRFLSDDLTFEDFIGGLTIDGGEIAPADFVP